MKRLIFCLMIIYPTFVISQTLFKDKKVNTKPLSKEYLLSRKVSYGKFTSDEYLIIKKELEKELNIKIQEGKSIFINYQQSAANCSLLKDKNLETYYYNMIKISNDISKKNNALDFFIYKKDLFPNLKIYVEKNKIFIQDSGFFSENIFKDQENCDAFFILKPNGKFILNYGTDSYHNASDFFENK